MPRLVPGVHASGSSLTTWMAATSAAMTINHWLVRGLHEQTDEAGGAFLLALELGHELRIGQAGREVLRLEIGRHDHEGVVVGRSGRGARAGVEADALGALAANIFGRFLAHFAFREASHVRRNAIGNPVK